MTFEEYYKSFGLDEYPFLIFSSEQEKKEGLFIKPKNYSLLVNAFSSGITAIVVGNRGSGKTKIIEDLHKNVNDNTIVCVIENYENVSAMNNIADFYALFLESITNVLLPKLIPQKSMIKNLSKDDKILLSYLISRFGNSISEKQLAAQIENIQLSWQQKIVNKFSKPITAVLNYFATATANFGNQVLKDNFGRYLPEISADNLKTIFPDIKFESDTKFLEIKISYDFLTRVLEMIKTMGFEKPIIFLDKLDEDIRLENDSDEIRKFIMSILLDNKLLFNPNLQLVFSIWSIPFENLRSQFRKQKNYVYDIDWTFQDLESVLNKRLEVYSNKKIKSYKDLFCDDVTDIEIQKVFELCNSNPRDLWHIFKWMFDRQYTTNCNDKISKEAIKDGLKKFVTEFDFYEYYPRRKGARKNTNDIYSYMQHLLKLTQHDFTASELEKKASTGGSTQNYITGMCNLGVTRKTSTKRNGSVVYEICDPKVIYAIDNELLLDN